MADRDPQSRAPTSLPNPPAPTAHDANPWTISAQSPGRAERPRGKPMPHRVKMQAPDAEQARPAARARSRGLRRYFPFFIFAAVIAAFVAGALEAARAGDYVSAVVPLVFLGIFVVAWWRSLHRDEDKKQ